MISITDTDSSRQVLRHNREISISRHCVSWKKGRQVLATAAKISEHHQHWQRRHRVPCPFNLREGVYHVFSADDFFVKHLSTVPWQNFGPDPLPHEETRTIQGWLIHNPLAVPFGEGFRAYTGITDRAGWHEMVSTVAPGLPDRPTAHAVAQPLTFYAKESAYYTPSPEHPQAIWGSDPSICTGLYRTAEWQARKKAERYRTYIQGPTNDE